MLTQEEINNLKSGDKVKLIEFTKRLNIKDEVRYLSNSIITLEKAYGPYSWTLKEDKYKLYWTLEDIAERLVTSTELVIIEIKEEIGI
jgi:hypothetical protein